MRTFDFNAIEQPRLETTLKDGTIVHLELPPVAQVEQLQAAVPKLRQTINAHDLTGIHNYYEMLAVLMSCNAENLHFTAEELETQYRITLHDIVAFYAIYMQFIDEVRQAKN